MSLYDAYRDYLHQCGPDDDDHAIRCPACGHDCSGVQPVAIHDVYGPEGDPEHPLPVEWDQEPEWLCPACYRRFYLPSWLYGGGDLRLVDETMPEEPEEEDTPL